MQFPEVNRLFAYGNDDAFVQNRKALALPAIKVADFNLGGADFKPDLPRFQPWLPKLGPADRDIPQVAPRHD